MVRHLSLFSGVGGYEAALRNLGVPHVINAFCDSNKNAAKAWRTLHGPHKNLRSVRLIDPAALDDFDLLTFSPPCQDISRSGQHAGVGECTRSGLMFYVPPIIREKRPTAFVMEQVPALATKYASALSAFAAELRSYGYEVKCQILNARWFGVPQNRRRLFLVGTLNGGFKWPKRQPLTTSLRDFLDSPATDVDRRIARTIRIGGRRSKLNDRHAWDAYLVDGRLHHLSASECLRLMGFSNDDFAALTAAGIPTTALYKMAGNAVVVPVVEAVCRSLFTTCFGGLNYAQEGN